MLTLYRLARPLSLPRPGYFSPSSLLCWRQDPEGRRALSSGSSSTTSPQGNPLSWVLPPGPLCSHCQMAQSFTPAEDWAEAPTKTKTMASPRVGPNFMNVQPRHIKTIWGSQWKKLHSVFFVPERSVGYETCCIPSAVARCLKTWEAGQRLLLGSTKILGSHLTPSEPQFLHEKWR